MPDSATPGPGPGQAASGRSPAVGADATADAVAEATGATVAGYEHARDELADVVRRLEDGGLTLEESLALWERGEHLARICQQWLDGARSRIDAVLAEEAERPGDETDRR